MIKLHLMFLVNSSNLIPFIKQRVPTKNQIDMKKIALFLSLLIYVNPNAYSQDEVTCLIYEMKLAVKSKDGMFYDFFLLAGKNPDTFQVIQVTNNRKTKEMPGTFPMFAALYLKKGKLVNKRGYKNFPYLKKGLSAYFNKVRLIYD